MADYKSRPRMDTLDTLRGITIVSMVVYHACFDMVYLFGGDMPWFSEKWTYYWQQSICITFILFAGVASTLSHSNFKRGCGLFVAAILMSIVSFMVVPEEIIVFGILHFMGIACILTAILQVPLSKIKPIIGFVVCVLLFTICKQLPNGYLGFFDIHLIKLPEKLYTVQFLSLIGLPTPSFFSGDYFPVFPWLFLFWAGFFFWKAVGHKLRGNVSMHIRLPFFTMFGRHSLLIYLLHQPFLYLFITLVTHG